MLTVLKTHAVSKIGVEGKTNSWNLKKAPNEAIVGTSGQFNKKAGKHYTQLCSVPYHGMM